MGITSEWVLILVILLAFAIKTVAFQTWLGTKVADYYSEELHVEVSVSSVDITFLKNMELKNIYIEDLKGDTLLFAPELKVRIRDFSISKQKIDVKSVELIDPRIKIAQYEDEDDLNYVFIEDYFASEDEDTTSEGWDVLIENIIIEQGLISYRDFRYDGFTSGFNENDMMAVVDLHITDVMDKDDGTHMNIESLYLADHSGFKVRSLESELLLLSAGFRLKDLKFRTNRSYISASKLEFAGDSWNDFSDFISEVNLSGKFRNGSTLFMSDLAFFTSDLKGADHKIEFDGEFRGTVDRLRLREMMLKFGDNSYVTGNFDFDGLPNFDETFLYLSIDEFRSRKSELEQIELPPFDGSNYIELPDNWAYLGEMVVTGNLTGFTTDFVAYADLKSAIGELSSDIEFRIDDANNNFNYQGRLMAYNFDVGRLYGISELGKVTGDISIDTAYGLDLESLYASAYGKISKLQVHGYNYTNITVEKGTFEKDYFIGKIGVRDPNLYLDYRGKIDFSTDVPKFDFDVAVNDAFLDNLNLLSEPDNVVMCFDLHVDSTSGSNLDNIVGDIRISNVNYHDPDKDFSLFEEIRINATDNDSYRRIEIQSEMVDAFVEGEFKFENLSSSFTYVASQIFPSLITFDDYDYLDQSNDEFNFRIDVYDLSNIALILDMDFSVQPETYVEGSYNSYSNKIDLKLNSDHIIYGNQYIDDLSIELFQEYDIVGAKVSAKDVAFSEDNKIRNAYLDAFTYNDILQLTLGWNDSLNSYAKIKGVGIVYSLDEFEFILDSSQFTMISKMWQIDDGASIRYDSSNISVTDLRLWTAKGDTIADTTEVLQELYVNGLITENPEDELAVRVKNFKLENLTPVLGLGGDSIFGTANGKASISGIYDVPIVVSDVTVDSLKYNKSYVGNVDFSSSWDTESSFLGLTGTLDRGEYKSFRFGGKYHIYEQDNNLDFTVTFDETDLGVIDEFLPSNDISEFHAYASGKINITGSPDNPVLKGKLSVIDGQVRINYLNTKYYFGGDILVDPKTISINSMPLSDEETHLLDLLPNGSVSGKLTHNNFDPESLDYNFDLEFDRLLLMNTTYEQNPLFYGIVYGSGLVNVQNRGELIDINIEESVAEKGTRFNLPLYGADEVVLQNFISFVDDKKKVEDYQVDLENIRLNMSLDVTPDAEILILFDPAIGDIMSGAAQGHLDIEISELGEFLMYGDLEVVRGDYLFTMYNVINKRFEVEPGGTIKWLSGSPYDAIVDLNTIYRTKAPLYNLVLMDDDKYKRKTTVECYMNLKNDLYNPDLAFNIKIPKADQAAEAALTKLRADNEEMTKQFFSLLVINNFVSSQSAGYGSYALNATTADLVNNQLSNWLSQLSDDVDLGFQYTPGDNLTQRELALAFETQLLNERLLISGNFGGARGTTVTNNEIKLIGDFTVEYKINEDGTFRIKGFNETNDDDLTNTSRSRYTQGVGVFYTEEFDKVGELKFIKTIKGWFRRKPDSTNALPDSTTTDNAPSGQNNNSESNTDNTEAPVPEESWLLKRNLFKEED